MISIAHFYAHSFSDLWSTCSKDAFVLQEPVHLTYDLQKRGELRVKIILPVAEWRGPQQLPKGKKQVRMSNLGCLVSLAKMKRKQVKSWQNKSRRPCIKYSVVSQQESECFVFRSSGNWVKTTLSWQSCLSHMRKYFSTICMCSWARWSGPLGHLENPHWVRVEWPPPGKVLERICSLPEDCNF